MCDLKQIAFPLWVSGCSNTPESFMNANKEQIKWPRLSTSMLLEPGRLTQQNLVFRGIFDCIFNPRSAWATQGVIVRAQLLSVILSQKKQNKELSRAQARSTPKHSPFSTPQASVTSLLSLTSKHWLNLSREWIRLWSSEPSRGKERGQGWARRPSRRWWTCLRK